LLIIFIFSYISHRILASASVCICTTVAVLTWVCVYHETDDPNVTPVEIFDPKHPPLMNLLKAYGIISFQFDIHPVLLNIQVDMKDKNKIGRAVFSGLLITCTFSIITTIIVYFTYDQSIGSNVLESLPKSITLYVIILLVTLQLCLSSAVSNTSLYQNLEDMLGVKRCNDRF
jgi:amino acid permease